MGGSDNGADSSIFSHKTLKIILLNILKCLRREISMIKFLCRIGSIKREKKSIELKLKAHWSYTEKRINELEDRSKENRTNHGKTEGQ